MGILDIEEYKKDVQKQLDYEKAIKEKLLKEGTINFKEQNIKRIEKRIEILDKELTQNIEEEPQEEYKEETKVVTKEETVKEKIIIDNDNKSETCTITTNKSTVETKKPSGPEYVKDKKLYESLKARLEEYKEASQYFSKIVLFS